MTTNQWVYLFSAEKTEGNKDMKDLLGGKGANLAEMCALKLAVPP
jgi:pyruvate,orthophosphate dikinase